MKRFRKPSFKYLLRLIIFYMFCEASPLYASTQSIYDMANIAFTSTKDSQKIPSNIVTAITQDKQGFIWIGSYAGLTRYDGYSFKRIGADKDHLAVLSDIYVNDMYVDKHNTLWIGTLNKGLLRFYPEQEQVKFFDANNSENRFVVSSAINSFAELDGKGLFIGSSDGLSYFDFSTNKIFAISAIEGCVPDKSEFVVVELLVDSNNKLWFSFQIDEPQVCVTAPISLSPNSTFRLPQAQVVDALDKEYVSELFEDSAGKIWIGTEDSGIFYLPSNQNVLQRPIQSAELERSFDSTWVNSIKQTLDDELWVATQGDGMLLINPITAQVIKHITHDPLDAKTISQNEIEVLFKDDSGILWIGTWGNGFNRYNPATRYARYISLSYQGARSLSGSNVLQTREDKLGRIWVGNTESRIDIINPVRKTISTIDLTEDITKVRDENTKNAGAILNIQFDTNNRAWIATSLGGLKVLDVDQEKKVDLTESNIDLSATKIAIDNENTIWLYSSRKGLSRVNNTTLNSLSLSGFKGVSQLRETRVNTMIFAMDSLWFGTSSGLFQLDLNLKELVHFTLDSQSSAVIQVNSITADKNTLLIAVTGGVYKLEKTQDGSFNTLTFKDVLKDSNTDISNLMGDGKGKIWHSGGWLELSTKRSKNIQPEYGWDGGTIWENAYSKTRDGILMFGGTKGVLVVKPELWQEWDYQPPIAISSLFINNTIQPSHRNITLEEGDSSFSVEFAALDFSSAKNALYQYKLEGFDKGWLGTSASSRRVTYTNLPGGNYVFRVRATNSQGMWVDKPLALQISQHTKRSEVLAYIAYFLVLILGIGYLIFKRRNRVLVVKKQQLDDLVEQRTKQLSEKNEELERALDKLHRASVTDQLTGAYNRRHFSASVSKKIQQDLEEYTQSAKIELSNDPLLAICLIDIDFFKFVNDTYGHDAGDKVLLQITQIIKNNLSSDDTVVRWGGEEFLVVMHLDQENTVEKKSEKIRFTVEQNAFQITRTKHIKCTCSIGIAKVPFLLQQPTMLSPEDTIKLADFALYQAKETGRNQCVLCQMPATLSSHISSEYLLDETLLALSKGDIEVFPVDKTIG